MAQLRISRELVLVARRVYQDLPRRRAEAAVVPEGFPQLFKVTIRTCCNNHNR